MCYSHCMRGGGIVREARRRAGLTQHALAARIDTTQSAVARFERGHTEPSFARVTEAIRACGLDLVPILTPVDDADWSVASVNLQVGPDERVLRHAAVLRFATEGRKALRDAGG
jgi:transcriptional regulator with XRE-family HTH domain